LPDLHHQLAGAGSIDLQPGQPMQQQAHHQSVAGDSLPDRSRRDHSAAPQRDHSDQPASDGDNRRRPPYRPSSRTALDQWM
jgi:hypothetical protein